MHVHILGICGTFMGGVAVIAKTLGYEVTGSDENIYPPMSDQLQQTGIKLFNGYSIENLAKKPDIVVVGNVIKRGNPELEAVLNQGIRYTSGPEWLADYVLQGRWVLAVAGTHGKTTTTSMLAWILDYTGLAPSFLIGGVAENFKQSARLKDSPYFVIEADEYDSAYFDKRSKFIHYRSKTVILNNLEFDHADIFKNLEEIKKQFHHLIRTIPGNGLIVLNKMDDNLREVIAQGCWTRVTHFNEPSNWHAKLLKADGSEYEVLFANKSYGKVRWPLLGEHNVSNALAAIAAAENVGINPEKAILALNEFQNVKRRMEVKGTINKAIIYDDFAHHPTAIKTTVAGLRQHVGQEKIIAVLEFGSYTMRSGCHQSADFAAALSEVDEVYFKQPKNSTWDITPLIKDIQKPTYLCATVEELIQKLTLQTKAGDHVLVMSNTGFDNFFKLLFQHNLIKAC
ncbi:MAG: UDP-N-acetylmuramate:L-alanyl-gamma-D-glutamyl-meso-diaminopimelate ligase [Gammaproteobacteria bacterium RIFCSPHIGHO2_12_FULL_35_23]|nr:MAG: UDP-N-acetylmuramate:L-alanyl-gamma-D-glutamyl-meso-diaminopimelate ligase [Gammaproteobacteria bacterium RIFCSPHIGHO2_12_FULL_35_23]